MAGLEGQVVKAGKAPGECVLDVPAGEVLLNQADHKEAEQPDGSVAENIAAKEQAAVDDEESGFPEGQDEERETGDSPTQAGQEVRELAAAAQAVDGVGAALDLRHDPGDDEYQEELNRLAGKQEAGRGHCVRGALRGRWSGREKLVDDEVCAEG